jgi:KaiC/GvpD/RAD55 family RecA-like ATPase
MAEGDARSDHYRVADALPVAVDGVDPGTNLLVSGPAMAGTRRLVLDLLAPEAVAPDPMVVMTTDAPGARVRRQFADREVALDPETCRVVDASGAPGDDDPVVERVSSPADLTSMGVAFTTAVDDLGNPARLRLGFTSVSTLLQYVDAERAFSFLHVLSRRASAAGYLGVFSIDPTAHEERFVNVVTSIFDAAVEIREVDGGREVRVRGLPDVPPEWTEFPY